MAGDFTYLPYSIAMVVSEYLLMIKAMLVWTARRDEARLRSTRHSCRTQQEARRWLSVFDQRSFASCSGGLYGRGSSLLLLTTRLTSALFFVVIGMGFNFARPEVHGHWQYFTNWNVGLISGYYTLATAASAYFVNQCQVHGWPHDSDPSTTALLLSRLDSPRLRTAGTFLSVYFCVASVTAIFVTTVNFVLLDPAPRFYNMTAHLFTSLSFMVEMSLNCVQLKKNEVVINMSWIMLWMSFIWPIVYFGVKPDWPYDFLDSSTPAIFAWFQLLFIVYFLIYLGWHAIAEWKLNKYASDWLVSSSGQIDVCDKPYESLVSEI